MSSINFQAKLDEEWRHESHTDGHKMLSKKHIEIVKNVKSSELCKMENRLNGFTRKYEDMYVGMKLSAKRQKEIFGFAVFGRKTICFNGRGITATIRVAFGQDYHSVDYTWKQIAELVEAQKTLPF